VFRGRPVPLYRASSASITSYLTVLSIFVWASKNVSDARAIFRSIILERIGIDQVDFRPARYESFLIGIKELFAFAHTMPTN
jgi:hypothetical protein